MQTPTLSPSRERLTGNCALVSVIYLAYSCDAVFAGAGGAPRLYYWIATGIMAVALATTLSGRVKLGAGLAQTMTRIAGVRNLRWLVLAAFATITLAGLAAFLRVMSHGYNESAYADQLPLIEAAVSRFAHDASHNPYRLYTVFWEMHFNYLPGLWLPYCPVEWSKFLSYRVVGLAAEIGVMLAWWRFTDLAARERRDVVWLAASAWLAAMFFLCNPHRRYSEQLHLTPWWLWLALFCVCAARRRFGWASFWMGMCCAASVPAWAMLPFWMLLLWRETPAKFWANLAATALPIVALFVPFLATNAPEFLMVFRRWNQVSGEVGWRVETSDVFSTFGLTSPLVAAGLARIVPTLQLAGVAALVFVAAARMRGTRGFFAFATAALWWFTMTAMVPKFYLYLPAMLMLSFAVLADGLGLAPSQTECRP